MSFNLFSSEKIKSLVFVSFAYHIFRCWLSQRNDHYHSQCNAEMMNTWNKMFKDSLLPIFSMKSLQVSHSFTHPAPLMSLRCKWKWKHKRFNRWNMYSKSFIWSKLRRGQQKTKEEKRRSTRNGLDKSKYHFYWSGGLDLHHEEWSRIDESLRLILWLDLQHKRWKRSSTNGRRSRNLRHSPQIRRFFVIWINDGRRPRMNWKAIASRSLCPQRIESMLSSSRSGRVIQLGSHRWPCWTSSWWICLASPWISIDRWCEWSCAVNSYKRQSSISYVAHEKRISHRYLSILFSPWQSRLGFLSIVRSSMGSDDCSLIIITQRMINIRQKNCTSDEIILVVRK